MSENVENLQKNVDTILAILSNEINIEEGTA